IFLGKAPLQSVGESRRSGGGPVECHASLEVSFDLVPITIESAARPNHNRLRLKHRIILCEIFRDCQSLESSERYLRDNLQPLLSGVSWIRRKLWHES